MANPEIAGLTQRKPSGDFRIAGLKVAPEEPLTVEILMEEPAGATAYARYRQLVDRVTDAFGDATVASRWLSTPSKDFDSQPPIEVAKRNGYDISVLEPVLIRIEHGVDF
jgi:hypothetical protein